MVIFPCLLDKIPTALTLLPFLKVLFEVKITSSIMPEQHAIPTKLTPTSLASDQFFGVNDALAVFFRAHSNVRISVSLPPEQKALVTLLIVVWKILVAGEL